MLVYSFWFYNRGGELLKRHGRKEKMEVENPIDPIDPIEMYYTGEQEAVINEQLFVTVQVYLIC